MINSFMLQWNVMVATQMSSWSFNIVEELLQKHYLSLPLSPGEMHLLQHLGALLHNKSLLIGESRDITIVLFSWKHRTQVLFKKKNAVEIWNMRSRVSYPYTSLPFQQPQPQHPAEGDTRTSEGLSSSGYCYHPSELRWRYASCTSSTPGRDMDREK